jgi:hypothetical protein
VCLRLWTKWTKNARERPIVGVKRGIFTAALINGLKGAAAGPDGKITTTILADYLYNHMKEYMAPEDRDDPNVSNEPDLDYHPKRPRVS